MPGRTRRSRPSNAEETVYPTVYPVEEKVGEELLQRLIVELLRPLIERWLAERGVKALTVDAPELYRELGVRELVVFDPDYELEADRFRFQVFRQVGKRGLVRVAVTDEDRVRSKVLGCYLRAVGAGETTRVRLATGTDGEQLFPTEAERERAARIAAEQELARLRAQMRKKRSRS